MAHAMRLGVQVGSVAAVTAELQRHTLLNIDAVGGQALNFTGVVGHQAYGLDAQFGQHRGGKTVVARICGQTQQAVGVERVGALFL